MRPAMKAASIGIAMGSGYDVALETPRRPFWLHNRLLRGLAQMTAGALPTRISGRTSPLRWAESHFPGDDATFGFYRAMAGNPGGIRSHGIGDRQRATLCCVKTNLPARRRRVAGLSRDIPFLLLAIHAKIIYFLFRLYQTINQK